MSAPKRPSLFRLRPSLAGWLALGRPAVTQPAPEAPRTRLGAMSGEERQRAAERLLAQLDASARAPLERLDLVKIRLRFDPAARLYWCSLDGGPSLPGFSLFEAILAAGYNCAALGSTELHPEIEAWAWREADRLAERVAAVLGSGGHHSGGH